MTVGASGVGALNHRAGALDASAFLFVGFYATGDGTGVFNFNGGVLRPNADQANFFGSANLTANVRDGGAAFDTNGKNVTAAQNLVHSTINGDAATDGGLLKTGAGTLTLTGANTYSGKTTVSAGTLLVSNAAGTSGTGTGSVGVQSGAILGGGGNLRVEGGGTSSPDNSAGRLTVGGNVSLAAGSTLLLELGGPAAGSQYDQVALGGAPAVNGANLNVVIAGGFSLAAGQTFFVLDRTGGDATAAGAFANAPGGVYTDAAGESFLVNYAATNPADGDGLANDVSLTALAVPEPATWALLLAAGAGGLLGAGRRVVSARRRSHPSAG